MRKAVAIPYVIALILGVGIIALVGFWFASSGGKFSGQSSSTYCENKALEYCTKDLVGVTQDVPSECLPNPSKERCQQLVGASGGGPDLTACDEVDENCCVGNICGGGLTCQSGRCKAAVADCGDADTHGSCEYGNYCDGTRCVACVDDTSPACSGNCDKCGKELARQWFCRSSKCSSD